MTTLREWIARLWGTLRPRRRDADLEEELRLHLELAAEHERQRGLAPEDAARAAGLQAGGVAQTMEELRDQRGLPWLDELARDARHTARGLRRSPWFAAAVILTMALGIGGNTAIFSVVDQLLLRPLPYPNGDQLATAYEALPGLPRNVVSPANWLDWQRETRTLQSIALWAPMQVTLTGVGEPARLNGQIVTAEFFPLLGVPPLAGRVISAEDDQPNAPRTVVLSYASWQHRFGGDPDVLGRVIQLNDLPAEIVGVMPPGFRFIYPDTDLWGAYRLDRTRPWRESAGRFANAVARLHPGMSIAAARTDMEAIARRLADTYEFNSGTGITLVPLREELTGQVETSLLILYAAVAVLLSIACFNVANLLLARAASRRSELAIRASLGAGRLAIVRQLLVESLLLALVGGALGVALARWSLDALLAFAPANLLRVPELYVDRRVVLYTMGLSVATGLIVGLMPALAATRRSLVAHIRENATTVTPLPRVRQTLVVGQVAMTVILLCGAGLLAQTLRELDETNSGFARRNVLTMQIGLPGARYDAERRTEFFRQAVDVLRALPGVESAAAANSLPVIGPLRGGSWFHRLGTPELPTPERPFAWIRVVGPGYFSTLRIPIIRGREFTDADRAGSGFVVNEAFARMYLSGIDPLSASLTVWMQAENPYLPIIGVAGDVSEGSIRDGAQPTVFYSHAQMPEAAMTLFVRTSRPSALVTPALSALRALDPSLAITQVRTIDEAFAESVARERLNALVSGSFAVSGLLLASLGLYGLLAFLVSERTKEIGIRIALGASLGVVTRSVVGSGFRFVVAGAALGIVGSLLLARSLETLLFGVEPHDLRTYTVALVLLFAVAGCASCLPARRAARIEPLTALRQE